MTNIGTVSMITTPVHAAYVHLILASGSSMGEERERQMKAALQNLKHACDNAGYDMVKRG